MVGDYAMDAVGGSKYCKQKVGGLGRSDGGSCANESGGLHSSCHE